MIKEYLKASYRNITEPTRYTELEIILTPLAQDMAFRWSHNGVPHLLVEVDCVVYSICYFKRHKTWRVFYPYQGRDATKQDFSSVAEVVKFLNGKKNADA